MPSVSLKGDGTVRRAVANSIGTPSTSMSVGIPKLRLPVFIVAGPIAASAPTEALFGNAACSSEIPLGVGVTNGADEDGAAPVRRCSKLPEPKNQRRSRLIGPPAVPPHRLS